MTSEPHIEKWDQLPEVVRNPPDEYGRIENEPGCKSFRPNLVWGGGVHRITVQHAVQELLTSEAETLEDAAEEYAEAFAHEETAYDGILGEDPFEGAAEAALQAVAYYREHREAFEDVGFDISTPRQE